MELRMTTDLETALPAEIGFNFEELKSELTERLHHYNTLVVTEDAIQDAKNDRSNLRKLKEAIDTRRKEVKRRCEQPYKAFEDQVKELFKLIDAPIAAIDGQIKTFEDQQRQKKYEEIVAAYDELAPDSIKEIVPLNRILDPKWLNKGTTMKSIRENMETICKRVNIDLSYIESTVPYEHLTAVRAKYIETLDLDAALDHRDRLVAAEQAFQQREAERSLYQVPVQEKPPVAVQEPAEEPAPMPQAQEKIYALRLEFHLTMDQANKLKKFLSHNQISYIKINKEEA